MCTHDGLTLPHTAGLSSIAVAEMPVRIDRSPPLYDVIGDGDDVIRGDVDYQRHTDTLCVHGTGVVDLESGIIQIIWDAGVHVCTCIRHHALISHPLCKKCISGVNCSGSRGHIPLSKLAPLPP